MLRQYKPGPKRLGGTVADVPPTAPSQAQPPPGFTPLEAAPEPVPAPPYPSAGAVRKAGAAATLEPSALPEGEIPKYAGSINLERVKSSDDVKRLIVQASQQIAKAGPVSLDAVQEAADSMGYGIEQAEKFGRLAQAARPGFLATRQVNVALQERLAGARDAYVDDPSPENFAAMKDAQIGALRGFKAAQDAASAAGLALRTFGMDAGANMQTRLSRAINQALLALQGKGKLSDEITRRMAGVDMDDPEEAQMFLRFLGSKNASLADKAFEAYMAGLLSNPHTHAVKLTSDLLMMAMNVPKQFGAAAVDAARSAIPGQGPRERFFGEGVQNLAGLFGGVQDGFRALVHTLATELPTDAASSFEAATRAPAIGGTLGRVVRAPMTAIQAINEFSGAMDKRGALYSLAYRQAAAEGLSGEVLAKRAAELVNDPPPSMIDAAHAEEKRLTFQAPLGALGQAVMNAREAVPGLRYILPFVKTPTNIAKEGFEWTPLNAARVFYKAANGGLKAGELSDQIAKTLLGTLITGAVGTYAANGHITGGGPVEKGKRDALTATGWQPYSFKIGDKYFSYARIEPVASVIGIAADAQEIAKTAPDEEWAKVMTQIGAAFAKNFTSKSYMRGISDALEAIHDPGRAGGYMAQSFAGGLVPSGVAAVARAEDPVRRDVQTIPDAIKARIPGLSEQVYPKRNIYGQPEPSEGTLRDLVSPVKVTHARGSEMERLIAQLGGPESEQRRTVAFGGRTIKLTSDEYDQLQRLSGGYVKQALDALGPAIEGLPDDIKLALVEREIRAGRSAGMQEFLADLIQTPGFQGRMAKGNVRTGAIPLPLMDQR